jgi:hypothetical protein
MIEVGISEKALGKVAWKWQAKTGNVLPVSFAGRLPMNVDVRFEYERTV